MRHERAIGHITQIPPGEGRVFEVHGARIAVFRTHAGAVHATQAACPHRGGPLADGLTDEISVICPLHERAFDLRSGAALGHDCAALRVHPLRVDADGALLVSLAPEMAEAAGD